MKKIKFLEYLLVTLFLSLGSLTYYGFVESQGDVVSGPQCNAYITAPFFMSPPLPSNSPEVTDPFSIKICAGALRFGELYLVNPLNTTITALVTSADTQTTGILEFNNVYLRNLGVPQGDYVLSAKIYFSSGQASSQVLNMLIKYRPTISGVPPTTFVTNTTTGPTTSSPTTTTENIPSSVDPTTKTTLPSITGSDTTQANPYFKIDQETKMLKRAIDSGEIPPGTTMSEWVDKRIKEFDQLKLPEDLKNAPVTDVLKTDKAETKTGKDKKDRTVFSGKGEPNSTIWLYIFSDPIVVSVNTDSQGNWTYELDQGLSDGKHEVYIAVKNSDGTVKAKSNPLTFFVGKAYATAQGTYTQNDKYKQSNSLLYYIIFAVALVTLFVALLFYLVTKKHLKKHAKTAQV